jgi:uncharacterized protein YjbJ (UPF0337 family)
LAGGTDASGGRFFYNERRDEMNEQHVKGAMDKAKGAVKDAAGKVMGDHEMQAEGKMDKAKGAARSAAGDGKDAIEKAADLAEHPATR